MAKLTVGQKAVRVVRFLLGLRHYQVAAILKRHGLSEEELARGWALLSRLTEGRMDRVEPALDEAVVERLDAWENKWFPIASGVLGARMPAVGDHLFRNLAQTSGDEVVVSVGTFLARLERLALPEGDGGMGAAGAEARELLVRRGIDEGTVREARRLLEEAATMQATPASMVDWGARDAVAEKDLWGWYLEWSAVARATIDDRRLLRLLGYLRNAQGVVEDAPETDAESDDTTSGDASHGNGTPARGEGPSTPA